MSNIDKIQEGASVLQQVDVSDIFTSLAMGIADAQKKLDDNSIAQLIKLRDTELNGTSLLKLGFQPAFYSFTYADISANIHLKMAMKDSFGISFNGTINFAKEKGYNDDEAKFIGNNKHTSLLKEYKSSKEVSFRVSDKSEVTIENEQFSYTQTDNIKKSIREYKEKIAEKEAVDLVLEDINSKSITKTSSEGLDVWIDSGYLRIEEQLEFNEDAIGLLRINDLTTSTAFDVNGSESSPAGDFSNNSSFTTDLGNAKGVNGESTIYGISKEGKFYKFVESTFTPIPSDLYFKFKQHEVLYGTSLKHKDEENLINANENNGKTEENHFEHAIIHQCLRFINNHDDGAIFTITGYTDPVGGKGEPNQVLAENRAKSMRDHIFTDSKKVICNIEAKTEPTDKSDLSKRKASITLNNNYIIFIGGNITTAATPTKDATDALNKFVYVQDPSDKIDEFKLDIKYGGIGIVISNKAEIGEVIEEVKKSKLSHSKENINERDYFIHDESIVKFTMYSSTKDSLKIVDTHETVGEGTETSSSSVISKDITESSDALNKFNQENGNNTLALAANIDFRMARQFEMSVEGSSSMSARMVSLPAPEGFLEYVKKGLK